MKRDPQRPSASTQPVEPKPAPRADAPAPGAEARTATAPERREPRSLRQENGGAQVQGFGDNAPAFLRPRK